MEIIKNLINRLRHAGVLLLFGFLLIIYIAFGFLYLQQGAKQAELEGQITQISAVVSKPLPSDEKLRAEYEEVNHALAPMTVRAALDMLVGIAEESGIDIDPGAGKLRIPSAKLSQAKVGGGNYQLLPFRNIHVQGNYDNVTAFISDLNSGKTLKTMVLKRLAVSQIEIKCAGEEGDRRVEFRNVASAVIAMMVDNSLVEILNPMSFADGIATNLMGDDPEITGVEGFPDKTTSLVDKGYTLNETPRVGYVLYRHDKITATDNFTTVSYVNMLTTKYYYTCEADGTVRQFNGADAATATEYLSSEPSKIETVASVDVDIYTKSEG